MKLNRFSVIFYCMLYISQIITCPACVIETEEEDQKNPFHKKGSCNDEKKISILLLLSISVLTFAHKNCARRFKHDKLGRTAWENINHCSCNCAHYRSQINTLKYTDPCPGCGHIFILSEKK